MEPSVLFVGRIEPEPPGGRLLDGARLEHVDDLTQALSALAASGPPPELIVLSESRPGEFSTVAIDALRALAPLARVWRLLGSWCEGEQRSGHPPAGCINTYWHQWEPRVARELARVRADRFSTWALPATATLDERTLASENPPHDNPLEERHGLIVVCARHTQAAAALADACQLAGYSTLVVGDDERFRASNARAVVWDTTADRATDQAVVARIRCSAAGAPVVAMVGFPRPEDARLAQAAGVAAVVSKPFVLVDLLWQLERVVNVNGMAAPL